MGSESVWVGPEWQGSKIVGWRYRCLRGAGCGIDGDGLSELIWTYEEATQQADMHDAGVHPPT